MSADLLTVNEAAALLTAQPATVRLWIRSGRLTAVKVGPRQWRIPRAALVDFAGTDAASVDALARAIERLADALTALETNTDAASVARLALAARAVVDTKGQGGKA
jgi:excisionase family DNA binding protein